jgi:aspartate racemase
VAELRRVGLLGGVSWSSTTIYYRLLNTAVRDRLGGHASAPVTIWSANFGPIEEMQRAGDWAGQGEVLAAAARSLQASGVDGLALAANTLHLVSDRIATAVDVPFIDMIDVVAKSASDAGHRKLGILATDYTMTSTLYPDRLAPLGVEVVVPSDEDRKTVHDIIYGELTLGVVTESARQAYLEVVERLAAQGVDGVLLACTEIGLLLQDGDSSVPLLDTSVLHCAAITDFILGERA